MMTLHRFLASVIVSAILCLGGYSSVWAQPANHTFSADPATVHGSDPTLVALLTGLSPAGTFTYDNSVEQTGTSPPQSRLSGAALYFGSFRNLVGSVNGMSFSDPIGRVGVGDDRFDTLDPPGDLTDIVILWADPPAPVNFVGFEIGGYRLVNVRMFWIEGQLGIGDFLRREDLPTLLPRFEGRLAFDFVLTTDPSSPLEFVFFDGLTVTKDQGNSNRRLGLDEVTTLDFDSLPSSQGWTYIGGPLTESEAFSLTGSTLTQNTVGSGTDSLAMYRMEDIVFPNNRMTLTFTARFLRHEILTNGSFGIGFNFLIFDPALGHRIGMFEDGLQVNTQFLALDTTVFRDYVLEMNPGGGFHLLVDGELFATGVGLIDPGFSSNGLLFGDSTGHENADAQITEMSFTVHDIAPDLAVLDATYSAFPNNTITRRRVTRWEVFPSALITNGGLEVATNILVEFELLGLSPSGSTHPVDRATAQIEMLGIGEDIWVDPELDQLGRTKIEVSPGNYILRVTVAENLGFGSDLNESNNQFEIPVFLPEGP